MGKAATKLMIVEDDPFIAQDLEEIAFQGGYSLTGVFHRAEDALSSFPAQTDLALLDITLAGDMDGIELGQRLRRDHQLPCIFITSYYDESTLRRAASAQPLAYIVKPFEEQDILANLRLSTSRLGPKSTRPAPLFIKSGGKLTRVFPDSISHLQAYDIYCHVYHQGQKLTASQSLKQMMAHLQGYPFVRVHRSFVVNLDHIDGIHDDQIIIGDQLIPLGRTYKSSLMERILTL